jgi:carboxypeptidase PM20D1
MYEGVCDSCLRFSAFVADDEEVARGVHGTNERITTRAYAQGVRFMIGVIREALL